MTENWNDDDKSSGTYPAGETRLRIEDKMVSAKIDTQAPERIWVTGEYSMWPTFRSFMASNLDHSNDDGTSDYPEYERRDLADARAAAAAQAMRDTEAIARRMMRVEVMENGPFHEFMEYVDEGDARTLGVVFANGKGFHYHSNIRGDEQDDAKVELLKRALDAALPLPDPAALDRLIAERVREAVQPIKEAWDWWQADSYDRCASVVSDAIDEAMGAARGSKEGQS